MGRVLLAYTHHRPLGAVTWALLCLGALLPIAALATRFKSAWPRFLPPFVLLFLLWAARAELSGAIGVQLGVGLMCAAAALIHRARQPLGGARFGWIALGAIALGVAFVFVSGQLPRLSEEAPLLLGAVGLLV
jgi:hypothetical protein